MIMNSKFQYSPPYPDYTSGRLRLIWERINVLESIGGKYGDIFSSVPSSSLAMTRRYIFPRWTCLSILKTIPEIMKCNPNGKLIPVSQTVPAKDIVAGMAGNLGPATKPALAGAMNPD